MIRTTAIAMFLGLAVTQCIIGQVQGDHLYQLGDSVRVLELRDEDGTHQAHYVRATQYFPQVAVVADLGEVNIRGQQGDTLELPFDFHETYMALTPEYRVYDTNTVNFALPMYTKQFRFESGDTLYYLFSPSYRFPRFNAMGGERTFEEDSANFCVPDSVLFYVDLIDAYTLEPVVSIDSILFVPVFSIDSMLIAIKGLQYDATIIERMERSFLPGPQHTAGSDYRLRLRPIHMPQLVENYDNRVLYGRYFWSNRLSAALRDWARANPKSTVPGVVRSSRQEQALHIVPNQLTRAQNGILRVSGAWDIAAPVYVTVHDALGKIVYGTRMMSEASGSFLLSFETEKLAGGKYFVKAAQGTSIFVGSITIF
jgi:hypothetical protein